MKFFAKDFPEKLTSSISLSEVIAKRVNLKQHGKEYMGLCPFHNEKTPSFTVNDQKGFYHCFGCQAHGNAIDFVMQTEGMEFKDSVVKLAKDFAIEIPWQESKIKSPKYTKIDREYELLEKICQIFQENLFESVGLNARKYLQNRGFNQEIIENFRLGYAINSYDFLHQKLIKNGFSESELLKSGIIAKNNNAKLYDKFRNRVVFPILDKKNRVIAFGGRVLDDSLPKYLNSAETDIFKKNQTLYNISNARKAIFDEKFVVVVEGYADVLALSAAKIDNVVAGLGTALSVNHLNDLFRISNKIVLCFDGDSAGINAAKRASEIALPIISANKNINFVFLPDKLDPDDFINKFGADSLKNLLKNKSVNLSQALFDFALIELGLEKKNNINPEEKAQIELILNKRLDFINDPMLKKYFSQFFQDLLYKIGKNDSLSKKKDKKYQKYQKKQPNIQEFVKIKTNIVRSEPIFNSENDILAQNIIALMLKFQRLMSYHDQDFDIKEISFINEELTELKDKIIEEFEENYEIYQENIKKLLLKLENYAKTSYNKKIMSLLDGVFTNFDKLDENEINNKFRLLLLKNALNLVQLEYKQALSKIDEIDTHHTAVIDQKITELFTYKNSLEMQIISLEKESI